MPTLAEVRKQIDSLQHPYIFWTQKEVKALPDILDRGEIIKAVTSGFMNGSTWLAVCTDRRVIFLNCGMFYGVQQAQMPLDRVQSIDHQFAIIFGQISVFDGIQQLTLTLVKRSSILPFVKATETAMYNFRRGQFASGAAPAAAATTTAAQPLDVASQISKLAELKEKGHLTEAEFQAQKKKLLG